MVESVVLRGEHLDGDTHPYGALPHRGQHGWYVFDRQTRRVAVIGDRPQTGLSAGDADALAALLNEGAALPASRWH